MSDAVVPFKIDIPQEAIDDLERRLKSARWPEPLEDTRWEYGAEQGYLQSLAQYWLEDFDWRAQEARLNAWPNFKTEIGDQQIHFIHARSPEADAIPLLITHGWPGSVVEFMEIIDPLTNPAAHGGDAADAFHVVCPSLPGYGFSQPNNAKGWGPGSTGRAWAVLMERLGYERYGAQGGDWGSFVTQAVAASDPDHCFAIHLNLMLGGPPTAEAMAELPNLPEAEQEKWARFQNYTSAESGYAQIQSTKPQTLGYALSDSPVGQLAWIAEKFRTWTDCDGVIENAVDRDALLTNISVYWFTNTGGSSGRYYKEAQQAGDMGGQFGLETPVGHACFPKEVIASPRKWVEHWYNIVHWTDMPRGGHFAAMEQPELLIDDIRTFFRQFR
jgi:pimeloyl-ACP methyl ester carboxylesterase